MQRKASVQLTVRSVPVAVERALRRRARAEGKSLNRVTVEALVRGAGVEVESGDAVRFHDLDAVLGTWVEDPAVDAALSEQRTIDPELWR